MTPDFWNTPWPLPRIYKYGLLPYNWITLNETILYLIRHGETDANASGSWQGSTDSPLNARGWAQARALAQRLARERVPLAAIYSSPLQRAWQTAQTIAQALGDVPLIPDPDLEEFHLGEWEGLTYAQLRDEKGLWEHMRRDPDFAPPGGESARGFAMRLLRSFQRMRQAHPGQHVAVVSHGGALATVLALVVDQDGSRWPQYRVANASLTQLVWGAEPRVAMLSDVSHLQEVGGLDPWH